MKQARNHSLAALLAAGSHARAGAGKHGVALDLNWGSQAALDAALTLFIVARDAHATAQAEWALRKRLLKTRKAAAYDLLFGSRDLLKRVLGKQYSTAWHGTGFINSLEIPRSVPRLQNTAGILKAYLTAHPELERAELMTAEMVGAALTDLTAAQNAVTLQKSTVGAALNNRRGAEKALRLQLRWLVQELTRVLDPLDDRWTAFGLNKPGLKQTPEVPTGLMATLMGSNALLAKWPAVPRAQYYRLWKRIVGVDPELVPAGITTELDFLLEQVPSNSEVELALTAVNDGGESLKSDIVTVSIL